MASLANPRLARSAADLARVVPPADRGGRATAAAGDRAGPARPAPGLLSLAPGIAFLVDHGFSREALAAVTARAARQNAAAEDVLIREGGCSEDTYYRLLASAAGLPFAEHFAVLRTPPLETLRRCELAHVEAAGDIAYVVAPRGAQIAGLLAPRGRALAGTHRLAVTSPARLVAALLRQAGESVARDAAQPPGGAASQWSARTVLAPMQAATLVCVAGLVAAATWFVPGLAWLALSILLSLSFLVQGAVRVLVLAEAPRSALVCPPPAVADGALPTYTLLVPLYREARVVADLVQALSELDYPPAKLDIKLLVEEDDADTRRAVVACALQPPFEVVVCPPGQPRTKPRALNVGLMLARGDLLVVYDAEDLPERDQLRLAAARFAASPDRLACLQASLAIDNGGESWLTRHFALEYAQLFDVALRGFARRGLPLPLGGTSNHFRVEVLRAVGGWDPWNVTEDADLGLRLARLGYAVGCLDSTTWEEAPATVRPWLAQRTRWMKGWIQTSLAHARRPPTRLAPLGPIRAAALYSHTFGLVLAVLGWPFFTAALAWHGATGALFADGTWTGAFSVLLGSMVAVLALALALWTWALGAAIRRVPLRPADAVLLLAYQLLVSCAGWCALVELAHAPFRWAKTEHGLSCHRRDLRRRRQA